MDEEREVEQLEERSERLGEEISDVREQWEAMRRDESVPGAPAPEGDLPPEAQEPPGDSDQRDPWPDE